MWSWIATLALSGSKGRGPALYNMNVNYFEDFEDFDDDKDDVGDFKTPGELAHTADSGQGKEESWSIKVSLTIG